MNKKYKSRDYNTSNLNPGFYKFLEAHSRFLRDLGRTGDMPKRAKFTYLGKTYEAWFEESDKDIHFKVQASDFSYVDMENFIRFLIKNKDEKDMGERIFDEPRIEGVNGGGSNLVVRVNKLLLSSKGHLSENFYKEAFRKTISKWDDFNRKRYSN